MGEEEGGGQRSGPGAAGTILLCHIISARPLNNLQARARSERALLPSASYGKYLPQGMYGARLLFLFLQEQMKDIIPGSGCVR